MRITVQPVARLDRRDSPHLNTPVTDLADRPHPVPVGLRLANAADLTVTVTDGPDRAVHTVTALLGTTSDDAWQPHVTLLATTDALGTLTATVPAPTSGTAGEAFDRYATGLAARIAEHCTDRRLAAELVVLDRGGAVTAECAITA